MTVPHVSFYFIRGKTRLASGKAYLTRSSRLLRLRSITPQTAAAEPAMANAARRIRAILSPVPIEDTRYDISDELPPDCLRSFTFYIKRWRNHPEKDMIRVDSDADNPIGKKFAVRVYAM